jgi:hypothetical protein
LGPNQDAVPFIVSIVVDVCHACGTVSRRWNKRAVLWLLAAVSLRPGSWRDAGDVRVDGSRFDQLTKTVAGSSRRSLLKAGLGSALGLTTGGFGIKGARAAVPRVPGEICRKHGDCASGLCGPKDRAGRQRCLCIDFGDCPTLTEGGLCDVGSCNAGVCATAIDVGASCGTGDLCTTSPTCQPDGSCGGGTTTCTAQSQCHEVGICDPQTGGCTNPEKVDGTPCETGVPNSSGATCQSGSCVCTPHGTDCGSRECGMGFTTCGQPVSCGECGVNETCDQSGMCVAD